MMCASPTLRRVADPAGRFGLRALVLCVLMAMPGASATGKTIAAYLGGGQDHGFRDMLNQELVKLIGRAAGIAGTVTCEMPKAQEVA
jgi:hypothetical protein